MKKINLKHRVEKVKNKVLLLAFFIILFLQPLNAKDIFQFGLYLYNQNDYYRAISEFQRYLFYYPKGKFLNDAYLYIVKSYYFAEQYNQAIESSKKYLNIVNKEDYRNRLYFYLATSYLRSENFKESEKIYQLLMKKKVPEKINEYSFYRLGWIYIFQTRWQKAVQKLEEFERRFPQSNLIQESKLLREELNKGINFKPLSPTLAAIMSAILPGSGQVYCKRIGDGLVAFVLVGILTYSSYYYYNNGPDGMFYGMGFLNILFYLGNIYTAYGSAHKYNRNFNLHLKERIFNSFYEDFEF